MPQADEWNAHQYDFRLAGIERPPIGIVGEDDAAITRGIEKLAV